MKPPIPLPVEGVPTRAPVPRKAKHERTFAKKLTVEERLDRIEKLLSITTEEPDHDSSTS